MNACLKTVWDVAQFKICFVPPSYGTGIDQTNTHHVSFILQERDDGAQNGAVSVFVQHVLACEKNHGQASRPVGVDRDAVALREPAPADVRPPPGELVRAGLKEW